MKLPKFKKRDRRSKLEKEIDAYVEEMGKHRDDANEYRTMATTVRILSESAPEKRSICVSDILKVTIPLIGTGAVCVTNWLITKRVTTFEENDIVTSKAKTFTVPWNS